MQHKLITQHSERILVIRRDNIGDLVCTTPAFAALRKHYPNAEIGALVNSYNAEILRGNPNIDKVFVYQKLKHAGSLENRIRALAQRIRLILRLRLWNPSVTILAKSSYDRHGLNFARQIGAKHIIGFVPDNLRQAKGLPDIRLKTPKFTAVHEVEALNQLLEPLNINDALGPLQVFADAHVVAQINNKLPEAKCRIALHVSAREPERRWGVQNYIAFIEHLLQSQSNIQVLLFWSPGNVDDLHHPGDDEVAGQIIKAVQSNRLLPMPTKNLTELIAALSLCDLFFGSDGGAMHVAAALNKRVLAMFENRTDKLNHWYPWQVINQMVHSSSAAHSEVEKISLQQVFKALDLLN